ncbi:alpha/beta-hydrolase [Phellopilus nigrolimitatus]|nr:alpha/beta-hydrolase [Phellopilus nigrolimitatus]
MARVSVPISAPRRNRNPLSPTSLYCPRASEDKAEHAALAARLARRTGCPVAVPNYRLTPRAPTPDSALRHPAHAADVLRALSFLVSWADPPAPAAYDRARLVLAAHSCGAHILACLFLDSSARTPELAPPRALLAATRGIALSEGIYDLDRLLARFPAYRAWFVANAFGDAPTYAPYDVTRYPLRAGAEHIRWLIVHSPADELVDMAQSEAFFEHLRALALASGAHGDTVQKDWSTITAAHNEMLRTAQYSDLVGSFVDSFHSH